MRDARVVHQHVQAAELNADALCRCSDRGLIRDVELDGVGIGSDALGGDLPVLEVARADEHGEAARCESLRDFKTDSLIGASHQGDGFVLHGGFP